MSLGGTRCQSMALTHSLTHSILINLFIKSGLNNFLLPPLLSIVLSKSVQSFFDKEGLERLTFLTDNSRAWVLVCRTPRGLKSAILVSCEFVS